MAKASDHFRQSDVALWGIIALVGAGLAVLGSNLTLLVPESVLGRLHQPRVAGSSIESLRVQVSALTEQSLALRRENQALQSRFAVQDKSDSEIVRRVGALEISLPQLLEDRPETVAIDRQSVTASIPGDSASFDTPGGSVSVRQTALPSANIGATSDQPLPEPVQVAGVARNAQAYGLAVGAAVAEDGTAALWSDLTLKLGPLLFGYTPLIVDEAGSDAKRIVVGPIAELADARDLCARFERVSIACEPISYEGTPLLSQ